MQRVFVAISRCLACRACQLACAEVHSELEDFHEALAAGLAAPRIYIEWADGVAVPMHCRQCEDAPCVAVCRSGALSQAGPDEPVLVDISKCGGCGFCVEACPYGLVRLAERPAAPGQKPRRVVLKCDLCEERQQKGLLPACVEACPVGALLLEEIFTRQNP